MPYPDPTVNAWYKLMNASNQPSRSAALDAFLRTPRARFDLLQHRGGGKIPLKFLEEMGASGLYPQLNRWYHRVPKKRNIRRQGPAEGPLYRWTTSDYKHVQTALRGHNEGAVPSNIRKGARNAAWLRTYMTRHALRAPALPLRAPRGPLYRGMRLTDEQFARLLETMTWSDKGFMSFSRDDYHAIRFGTRMRDGARHPVLFRLKLEDVARGTPWVWYTDDWEQIKGHNGWNIADEASEHEVTLPPGTLTITRILGAVQAYEADVTFTPAPEYAWKPRRKGTRESNTNILWNIFSDNAPTRKRARPPSSQPPRRSPRKSRP